MVDSVRVVGSAIDVTASQQGGSVSIIPAGRDPAAQRADARWICCATCPAWPSARPGPTGGVAGLFIRGGNPNFNLVQIDGVPVNAFGGNFDFAHIPTEALDHMEVIRGPQSALYGPYANSGVVNFVTRQPERRANLDVVAEGGTYDERRFGISGGGTVAGFGIVASASRIDDNGPVANSDYRNQDLMLNVTRRFGRQSSSAPRRFRFQRRRRARSVGLRPVGRLHRHRHRQPQQEQFSDYSLHYQVDISDRVREELSGALFSEQQRLHQPVRIHVQQGPARRRAKRAPS